MTFVLLLVTLVSPADAARPGAVKRLCAHLEKLPSDLPEQLKKHQSDTCIDHVGEMLQQCPSVEKQTLKCGLRRTDTLEDWVNDCSLLCSSEVRTNETGGTLPPGHRPLMGAPMNFLAPTCKHAREVAPRAWADDAACAEAITEATASCTVPEAVSLIDCLDDAEDTRGVYTCLASCKTP